MTFLHVEYDMEVQYEKPVSRDHFTIRCIPAGDRRQQLIRMHTEMTPDAAFASGTDSFGNGQIYGCVSEPHDRFLFHMSGDVKTQDSSVVGTDLPVMCGIYRYPHGKCRPWPEAEEFLEGLELSRCGTELDRCIVIMNALSGSFSYVKNTSTMETTAQEAWKNGCGVCQDYAHIYITLLRMAGVPARYVCGFVLGEGESHAWVEAFCDGLWIALDPTYNREISDQYIKLGHGRDAADCPINRGIILGGGAQRQYVRARVLREQEYLCAGAAQEQV